MNSNTKEIIHEVRNEFEDLLDFVTKDATLTQINEMERGIWQKLLQIGYLLLKTYFQTRCEAYGREALRTDEGQKISFVAEKERRFYSIFGVMKIARPYFYKKGEGGFSPLDELMGLGGDIYSEMLREMHEELSVHMAYGRAIKFMNRFLHINLSTRVLQQLVKTDAEDVVAFYDKKVAPPVKSEGKILVAQADGKGIPMLITALNGQKHTRKKESVVTTLYSIDPNPRSPDEVLATFFDKAEPSGKQARNRPQNKEVWATLTGKDTAFQRLYWQVEQREGDHFQHRVALCDGDDALQSRLQAHLPRFTLILDFIHAHEYLWDAAHALFSDDDPQRDEWMLKHARQLLASQTKPLIASLEQQAKHPATTPSQQVALTKAANYFTRNTPYIDYKSYLAQGFPIASGVIEGACRHLVKDRMELSGMRWVQPTAESLLQLRAVSENEDWDAYHDFRRKCQQRRLYQPRKSTDFVPTLYHQLPLVF